MRMQKEEKIVVVLLLMALGSLAVAFWAFGPEGGASSALSSSPDAAVASTGCSYAEQTLQGQVLEIKTTKSGGNLILRLDSTALPIFVPSSAGAEDIKKKIQPGDKIQVKGSISDYQGEKELKVSHAADIQKV